MIFPQKSTDDDAELVLIIGRKEKAEAAKTHLQQLIQDLVSGEGLVSQRCSVKGCRGIGKGSSIPFPGL